MWVHVCVVRALAYARVGGGGREKAAGHRSGAAGTTVNPTPEPGALQVLWRFPCFYRADGR